MFSPSDMKELRTDVQINDPEVSYASEIRNPRSNKIVNYPLIQSPDFFFPLGI